MAILTACWNSALGIQLLGSMFNFLPAAFFFPDLSLLGYFSVIILSKLYTKHGSLTNAKPAVTAESAFLFETVGEHC